jgi:hypothetical protein
MFSETTFLLPKEYWARSLALIFPKVQIMHFDEAAKHSSRSVHL